MGLLDTLLSEQGSAMVGQMARNLNMDQSTAENAIRNLMPAISRGLQNNIGDSSGLDSLLGALNKGSHKDYIDIPERMVNQSATEDGNAILGHIFGSKDVSRNVAAHAASTTGLDTGLLKKMLPLLATAAMGMMRKQSTTSGGLRKSIESSTGRSNMGGLLTSFLDADNDGSIADDLLKMATKFL